MAVELDGMLKHTVFLVGLVAKSSRDISQLFKGLACGCRAALVRLCDWIVYHTARAFSSSFLGGEGAAVIH
jgi:hypothetical protein